MIWQNAFLKNRPRNMNLFFHVRRLIFKSLSRRNLSGLSFICMVPAGGKQNDIIPFNSLHAFIYSAYLPVFIYSETITVFEGNSVLSYLVADSSICQKLLTSSIFHLMRSPLCAPDLLLLPLETFFSYSGYFLHF